MNRRARTIIATALATAAVSAVSLSTCSSAFAADLSGGPKADAAGRGAHQVKGSLADKYTQVTMKITNDSHETMRLSSASDGGTGVAWQDRATDIAAGQTITVSDYAAWDAEINLQYFGEESGDTITLHAETPSAGSNQASGSASNGYRVDASVDGGFNPTSDFDIHAGYVFNATGSEQWYEVPPGVTSLDTDVKGGGGGSGGSTDASTQPDGAEISGLLSVTPGEDLLVGVGGRGGSTTEGHANGGFGLTANGVNYSGGAGYLSPPGRGGADGGGGASVVLESRPDQTMVPLIVAGGGGGNTLTVTNIAFGGQGGYQQKLAGGNGGPDGQGGQGGGNSVAQGQDSTNAGGAGGGGVHGGLAGANLNQGGGAGESYYDTSRLSDDPQVSVASGASDDEPAAGSISFSDDQ